MRGAIARTNYETDIGRTLRPGIRENGRFTVGTQKLRALRRGTTKLRNFRRRSCSLPRRSVGNSAYSSKAPSLARTNRSSKQLRTVGEKATCHNPVLIRSKIFVQRRHCDHAWNPRLPPPPEGVWGRPRRRSECMHAWMLARGAAFTVRCGLTSYPFRGKQW